MDKFVKNFIIMSIVYLAAAAVFGIAMIHHPRALAFKFVHSHLNMLGWVSMMIYGVGYHILPKFAGKFLKSPKIASLQFWIANASLIVMLLFYSMNVINPDQTYVTIATLAAAAHAFSIGLFLYNMLATLLPASPPPQR